jgi:hypothetical protein
MRKRNKPVLDSDKRKQKMKVEEEVEKIEVLGQESESKAAPFIQEELKKNFKEGKEKEARILEELHAKRKLPKVQEYIKMLLFTLHDEIQAIKPQPKTDWAVYHDGKGIVVMIQKPGEKKKIRAFRMTYEPKYDLFAASELLRWAEDIIDPDKPDIWMPTK